MEGPALTPKLTPQDFLRARLDEVRSRVERGVCDCPDVPPLLAALEGVLPEHRPEWTEYTDGDGDDRSSVDCSTCDNGGVPDTWPCPTIRALVSALSSATQA